MLSQQDISNFKGNFMLQLAGFLKKRTDKSVRVGKATAQSQWVKIPLNVDEDAILKSLVNPHQVVTQVDITLIQRGNPDEVVIISDIDVTPQLINPNDIYGLPRRGILLYIRYEQDKTDDKVDIVDKWCLDKF